MKLKKIEMITKNQKFRMSKAKNQLKNRKVKNNKK